MELGVDSGLWPQSPCRAGNTFGSPVRALRRRNDAIADAGFNRWVLEWACKPGSVFVWSSIWGVRYRTPPAVYREDQRAASTPPSDLASSGVCRAGTSPHRRCALTAPFHPYPAPLFPRWTGARGPGGIFLLHFPSGRPARPLACTLPCEARTFLKQQLPPATTRPTPAAIVSDSR